MKILIVRLSSIGDIVLTSPLLRCIKQQLDGVQVHFLTKEMFRPLIEANPYVDKLFSFQKEIGEVSSDLKKEKYDLIIDLHHNLRSARLKSMLKVRSFSFPKLNIEKWIKVYLKIDILPKLHVVDRYFETTRRLGVQNDGKGLEFFIPPEQHYPLEKLPEMFQNGYVGLVVGAGHQTKQLPIVSMARLISEFNKPVILLGGEQDHSKAESIIEEVKKIKSNSPIVNGCGQFNINQSASLVKQAEKIVTHDTGLMHIAAAFKKEIVSIWGNTIPEFGMSPYYGEFPGKQLMAQVDGLGCRPCTKIGFDSCPKKHFKCMNDIDLKSIIDFVNAN